MFKFFYSFGAHIGTSLNIGYNTILNQFLFCVIRVYAVPHIAQMQKVFSGITSLRQVVHFPIFDLAVLISLLRRACAFLFLVAQSRGTICFYQDSYNQHLLFVYSCIALLRHSNHSLVSKKWRFGAFTNYYSCFFNILIQLFLFNELLYAKRPLTFVLLFFKVFFFTSWQLSQMIEHKSFRRLITRYWRVIIFLRHFKTFYKLPTVVVAIIATHKQGIVAESSRLYIPTINVVDTIGEIQGTTYPIFSNTASIPIALFYFYLFFSVYRYSLFTLYKYLYQ